MIPPFRSHPVRRARSGLGGALVLALLLAACDGDNLFRSGPGLGTTGPDNTAPTVTFEFPRPDTTTTVAPLDSLFTQVRVQDNRGVAEVQLSGFVLRGDPALGTQTSVPRFVTKTVRLDSLAKMPRDTVLRRFLTATADSLPESTVYVVATARDSSGNVGADTVRVSIGGPRVQVVSPTPDTALRAGTALAVRLSAEDRADLIGSLRVTTTGAFGRDTTLTLRVPERTVDTVVVLPIPGNVQGNVEIRATATSGRRLVGESRPVRIRILAAAADNVAPRVSFSAVIPSRLEVSDSLSVTVTGTDETRVDSLGATILAIRRTAARDDTLGVIAHRVAVAPPVGTRTLQLSLAPLGLTGLDTMTVSFEVVAFAKDGAGNCAAATSPNVVQSLPCRTGYRGATLTEGAGALTVASLVRGRTVLPPSAGDTLADLVSDRLRVFASNRTRNRVEVLPVGTLQFGSPILVGSRPWGLAVTPDTSTLLVANSGGAGSISRVALSAGSLPATEDFGRRIVTENVVLYLVRFQLDSESGRVTLTIPPPFDYSDRPQFLAQTSSGRILYSTVPTRSAPDGTVQEYNPNGVEPITDLFVEYARRSVEDQFVVRRADAVSRIIQGAGDNVNHQLRVCDHRPGEPRGSICFPQTDSEQMTFQQIQDALTAAGTDAVLDYNVDPTLVGLSDTTFLAVSKDHRTVAVGEGMRAVGRILSFGEDGAGNLSMVGNTQDLVNNASDRVKGLGLNRDGSVGVARGNTVYLFRRDLRKLGESQGALSGAPTGGVAMHPDHPNVPLAFVSGQDAAGRPFIDVVDTRFFSIQRRLFIRNPVVGTVVAIPTNASTGVVVRLYAITSAGVVAIDLTQEDLRPVS